LFQASRRMESRIQLFRVHTSRNRQTRWHPERRGNKYESHRTLFRSSPFSSGNKSGDPRFTAPLTGITAAVVGVAVNLVVFFAWHVLWPDGTGATPFAGEFRWFATLVSIAAFIALWKYKLDILNVIGSCAVLYEIPGVELSHEGELCSSISF
jgi:hypothetical protein